MKSFLLTLALFSTIISARSLQTVSALDAERHIDSMHVFARPALRVDQLGYRPADPAKWAWAANTSSTDWQVLRLPDSGVVLSGTLGAAMKVKRPGMTATAAMSPRVTLWGFSETAPADSESLRKADLSGLTTPGQYVLRVGSELSAPFVVADTLYAFAQERLGWFFGAQRCGSEPSWLHGACHLKDGSALGVSSAGALQGGWHDCGDHLKEPVTIGYAALMLGLAHAIHPASDADRAGVRHGSAADGVPDLLRESLVGVDYIFHSYLTAKKNGLLSRKRMYSEVGNFGYDHGSWGLPELQENMSQNRGGPDRAVDTLMGADIAGTYAAALALAGKSLQSTNKAHGDSLLVAAQEIYDSIMIPLHGISYSTPDYSGNGSTLDEEAMAAVALWWATQDTRFRTDLLSNSAFGTNPSASSSNGNFPSGFLSNGGGAFSGGIGSTNYATQYAIALYALAKLILPDVTTATQYGVTSPVRDSLLVDITAAIRMHIKDASNGIDQSSYPGINVGAPYLEVYRASWGFNRYNLGLVLDLLFLHDLTGDANALEVALANLHYLHGANPWGISFQTGVGIQNMQHLHHRASNGELATTGVLPYASVPLIGAICGGGHPEETLEDDAMKYTTSESCLDFAATATVLFSLLSPADPVELPTVQPTEGPSLPGIRVYMTPYEYAGDLVMSVRIDNQSLLPISPSTLTFWGARTPGDTLFPRLDIAQMCGSDGYIRPAANLPTVNAWVGNKDSSRIDIVLPEAISAGANYRIDFTINSSANFGVLSWSELQGSWSLKNINTATGYTNGDSPYTRNANGFEIIVQEATYMTLTANGQRLWGIAPNDPTPSGLRNGPQTPLYSTFTKHFDLLGRLH